VQRFFLGTQKEEEGRRLGVLVLGLTAFGKRGLLPEDCMLQSVYLPEEIWRGGMECISPRRRVAPHHRLEACGPPVPLPNMKSKESPPDFC
jgi:hypothetical protein